MGERPNRHRLRSAAAAVGGVAMLCTVLTGCAAAAGAFAEGEGGTSTGASTGASSVASTGVAGASPRAQAVGEAQAPTESSSGAPTSRQAPATGNGQPVRIAFAGDVHFEPPLRGYLDQDPASVFAPIKKLLGDADLTIANLETAVTTGGDPAPAKAFRFRAPASAFDALRAGGVDVVTVANNHGMDYGLSGLNDTLRYAKKKNFPVIGAGQNDVQAYAPYRTTIKGQRIGVIGATQVLDNHLIESWSAQVDKPGLASAKREKRLLSAVRQTRGSVDTLIVYLHYGVERVDCPTQIQQDIASKLVAAGADIVVGSHAHVLLGAGMKGKAFVDYGLGNFAFYANAEQQTRTGVLTVTATGRTIDGYRWRPARITNGRPVPLTGEQKGAAVRQWNALRSCTNLAP